MESQIEQITPVECRVRVTIPWTDVSPRLDTKLRELKKTARIPGFRQGMIPPKVVERMFGKSARAELARDLVQETFETAVVSHKTTPLTQPVLESSELELGQAFTYQARFEVAPKIEPKDYLGVPVQTLAHWRINGRGPRAFRVGKYLRYDPADVADWLESQRDSA